MGSFVDIGPECFANEDTSVVCYKGENYYKACDALVIEFPDGGASHCVKRVNHPGKTHEDFDGRIRDDTAENELTRTIYSHMPPIVNPFAAKAAAEGLAAQLIQEGWTKP